MSQFIDLLLASFPKKNFSCFILSTPQAHLRSSSAPPLFLLPDRHGSSRSSLDPSPIHLTSRFCILSRHLQQFCHRRTKPPTPVECIVFKNLAGVAHGCGS